jgi:hypothetical protein
MNRACQTKNGSKKYVQNLWLENLKEIGHMRVLGLDENLFFDGLLANAVSVSDCTAWTLTDTVLQRVLTELVLA